MSLSPPAISPGWELGDLHTAALLAIGLAIILAAVAISREHERTFSASVLYVAIGAAGALALSLLDVEGLDPEGDHLVMERLSELALIAAVFSAGLTIERHVQRRSLVSLATLLVVVMPLTIAAIALFGMWAMGLSFGAALLLGAVLAPTDPVLAGDVGLSAPGGEVYGEPRLSLHTEAGFNDGLASPFVVLGLFVAELGGSDWVGEWIGADLLYGAGVGLALGAAAGFAAAAGLTAARGAGVITGRLEGFVTIGLMLAIYGASEAVGTYGLLAVFAAGFTFRRYEFDHEMHHPVHQGAHAAGKALELIVLLMLGTMLTTAGLGAPGVEGWLLVPVLLLLIRPALVFATAGRRFMDVRGRLFLAFFGVRGVAALFYAAVVVEAGVLEPGEQHVVVWTTIVCVVCSIVVHGVSAAPLTRRWLGG
ncbi:MAG TPA: cation:proton antiporter [Thermoleophilaceae bacterium]|jgi:NhaP-type Na+/H+ or K+/H+ antiporter